MSGGPALFALGSGCVTLSLTVTSIRWLVKMFAEDRMFLHHVEGPAGPVYQVGPGTHRAHAARIWGLPYVLGRVHVGRLAKPLRPRTQLLQALREGLCRRGLLTADTDDELWYLRSVVADWVLSPLPFVERT